MQYVIRRTDQGGGWVARPGHPGSYTGKLQHARVFGSMEEAERNRCPGNEIILPLDEEFAWGGEG
jgi:hypothetical protein